jgi:acyl-CoA thioesterase FadM
MDLQGERLTARLDLRYEDVAQDGRLRIDAIPVGLAAIWRTITLPSEVRSALFARGIYPILTRFEIEGDPGPFAVHRPLEVEGSFAVAHDADDAGSVRRVFLDMTAEMFGPKDRTNLPPPPDRGTRARAGRVFAEHVFTRPFAPPGERKVTGLELGGKALSPGPRRTWKTPESAMEPPSGARPLDPEPVLDPTPVPIGLFHTDSNQHVNSLVYPRLFEDAALRRVAALGRSTQLLARKLEMAFRRPSFAGELLRVTTRAFEDASGRLVVAGAFFADDPSRPRVYATMTFET